MDSPVILASMTYRVGPKGQVVIPKAIREQLGIRPGDEVVVEQEGREVRIRLNADDVAARRKRIQALRGIWAGVPGLSTKDLEADRREDGSPQLRRPNARSARRMR